MHKPKPVTKFYSKQILKSFNPRNFYVYGTTLTCIPESTNGDIAIVTITTHYTIKNIINSIPESLGTHKPLGTDVTMVTIT